MIDSILKRSLDPTTDQSIKDLLDGKLNESGLSKTQFERLSGIQRRSLDGILNGNSKQTDIINLIKLSEFLELDFEELLVLYFKRRPIEEIKELQDSMDVTFINKHFDLKTLISLGFVSKDTSIDNLKNRICEFFQLESIYHYEKDLMLFCTAEQKNHLVIK